jgi:hypothetical protein
MSIEHILQVTFFLNENVNMSALSLRIIINLYFSDTAFFPVTKGVASMVSGSPLLQGVQPMVVVGGTTGGGVMFLVKIEH